MSLIFLTIVQMSITSSFVILAVLLLRLCLKRAPKLFSYVLWSVVLFRLVCPVALEGSFGIPQSLNNFVAEMGSEQNIPNISSMYEASEAAPHAMEQSAGVDNIEAGKLTAERTEQDKAGKPGITNLLNKAFWSRLVPVGHYIWLMGMAVLLFLSGVSYFNLKKRLKGAIPAEENVYELENLPTPFVLGIFRPHIFLPTGIEGKEREYILAHEKMHIRRLDHIAKLTGFLVLVLHWMNPLVWLAFLCMTKDMEMSCDEAVIRKIGSNIKKEYSVSLMHMAMHKSSLSFAPLAFGEGDARSRIVNVLHYKKAGIGICAICICVLLGAVMLLTTNQQAPKNQMRLRGENVSEGTSIVQEYKLTEDVKSYMVFSVYVTEGQETGRNVIAAGTVTEENQKGGLHILNQYTKQEEQSLTITVTENANSQFMAFALPDYTMRAETILWDNENRYHEIQTNTPYLLTADYIGSDITEHIEAFTCEDLMKDDNIWDAAMEQSAQSGISMVLVYFLISEKSSEELSENIDGFALYTEAVELTSNKDFPIELEQMYKWRTPYIGDNSAVGNITDYWFMEPESPLTKDGVELQTSTKPYEATVKFQTEENAESALQKNLVYLERDAALFFALIENAGKVNVMVNEEEEVTFTREELEENYGKLWESSENFDDFCKLYQFIVYAQEQAVNTADSEIKDMDTYREQIEQWAGYFCDRDGEGIISMLSETAKEQFSLLESAGGTVSFGVSSPWPMQPENSFIIQNINTADNTAEILYYAMTSEPHICVWQEKITFTFENDTFIITGEELNYLDSISSEEEYMSAYPNGVITGTQMDYVYNGLGETLNNNALLSSSNMYADLFSPDTAAVFLLNLSDNKEEVETAYGYLDDGTDDMFVTITFVSSGEQVTVKMTQPFGENGIWVPQNI